MIKMILFGITGVILLILLGLLIVILKEHKQGKKQFETFMQESREEISGAKDLERIKGQERIEPNGKSDTKQQTSQSSVGQQMPKTTSTEVRSGQPISHPSENEAEIAQIKNRSYGIFDYQRLLEMGLSQSEAEEFVIELIQQLETAVPQIESAVSSRDLSTIERITHGIKGAALNIGHGGVADLLVDFNTYMKNGSDIDIAKAYLDKLKESISDLKVKFSQITC